jgi:hypothetical protein
LVGDDEPIGHDLVRIGGRGDDERVVHNVGGRLGIP